MQIENKLASGVKRESSGPFDIRLGDLVTHATEKGVRKVIGICATGDSIQTLSFLPEGEEVKWRWPFTDLTVNFVRVDDQINKNKKGCAMNCTEEEVEVGSIVKCIHTGTIQLLVGNFYKVHDVTDNYIYINGDEGGYIIGVEGGGWDRSRFRLATVQEVWEKGLANKMTSAGEIKTRIKERDLALERLKGVYEEVSTLKRENELLTNTIRDQEEAIECKAESLGRFGNALAKVRRELKSSQENCLALEEINEALKSDLALANEKNGHDKPLPPRKQRQQAMYQMRETLSLVKELKRTFDGLNTSIRKTKSSLSETSDMAKDMMEGNV